SRAGELHKQLLESGDRRILSLTDGEESLLRPEVEAEDEASLVLRVLDTFFDVIDQENDPATRGVIFAVLEKALVSLVQQQQWISAGHILQAATDITAQRPELLEMHREAIDSLFRTAADPGREQILAEALNRTIVSPSESEEPYISALTPRAIPALCRLL